MEVVFGEPKEGHSNLLVAITLLVVYIVASRYDVACQRGTLAEASREKRACTSLRCLPTQELARFGS